MNIKADGPRTLDAIARSDGQCVVVIAASRRELDSSCVTEVCVTDFVVEAEEFMYGFDSTRVLTPATLAIRGVLKCRRLIDSANDAYYTAARRCVQKLNDHEDLRVEERRREALEARHADGHHRKADVTNTVTNRIKSLFGIKYRSREIGLRILIDRIICRKRRTTV